MKNFVVNTKYSTRLNSFHKTNSSNTLGLIKSASLVKGLTCIDLNYPEHLNGLDLVDIKKAIYKSKLKINGIQMRYNKDAGFSLQALSSGDPVIRNRAVNLTYKAIDCVVSLGGTVLSLWPSQEGYDYAFQIDYYKSYKNLVASLKKICKYNQSIKVSIEYKPNDSFAFSLVPNVASAIILIEDVGFANIGLTLDFCHLLMSQESPAAAADFALNKSRVFGIHLNDGYGFRDDGLMVGSVHPMQTIELLSVLYKYNYDGVIYFDTFPSDIDPVKECEQNIDVTNNIIKLISMSNNSKIMEVSFYREMFIHKTKLI